MPNINFSMNWSELKDLKKGREITTIRWIDKYDYYNSFMNVNFNIRLKYPNKWKVLGKAILKSVEKRYIDTFDPSEIKADTFEHYTVDDFFMLLAKFYGRKDNWKGKQSEVILLRFEVL